MVSLSKKFVFAGLLFPQFLQEGLIGEKREDLFGDRFESRLEEVSFSSLRLFVADVLGVNPRQFDQRLFEVEGQRKLEPEDPIDFRDCDVRFLFSKREAPSYYWPSEFIYFQLSIANGSQFTAYFSPESKIQLHYDRRKNPVYAVKSKVQYDCETQGCHESIVEHRFSRSEVRLEAYVSDPPARFQKMSCGFTAQRAIDFEI